MWPGGESFNIGAISRPISFPESGLLMFLYCKEMLGEGSFRELSLRSLVPRDREGVISHLI